MRLIAFSDPNADDPTGPRLGVVSGETAYDITRSIGPDLHAAIRSGLGAIQDLRVAAPTYRLDDVALHAPIPNPARSCAWV